MRSTVKSGRKTTSAKSGAKSKTSTRGTSAATSRNAKNPPRNKQAGSKKTTAAKAGSKSAPKKSEPQSQEESLKKIFHELLKDTLNAEKQLVKALPKMAKASTSPKLAKAFEKHLAETEKQVARLEKVFQICDLKVAGKKCEAMEGLVEEGQEAIKETAKGSWVRDVALIVAAQKVEHYEIAAYGSLRSIASILGYEKAADLLQKTLDEESAADEKLTAISETVNPAAKDSSSKEKSSSRSGSAEKKQDPEAKRSGTGGKTSEVENAVYMDDEEEEEDDDSDYDREEDQEDDEEEENEDRRSGSLGNSL